MIAAIMQPTYLPWSGYFDLIDQSDVFVFLDTVQFEKQSWQQRNRIKTPSGPLMLTVPCVQSLPQRIVEVRIEPKSNWRRKHWLSIAANYSKAPYWHDFREPLEAIFSKEWDCLVDLNIALITLLTQRLGIEAVFLRTSELRMPERTRISASLVEIYAAVGGGCLPFSSGRVRLPGFGPAVRRPRDSAGLSAVRPADLFTTVWRLHSLPFRS